MYSQEIIDRAKADSKRALYILLGALGVILAVTVVMTVLRLQLALTLTTLVCGAAVLVVWDAYLSPKVMYSKYLKMLDTSLIKETSGAFAGYGGEEAVRDGVPFAPLTLTDGEGIERLFYIDLRLKRPEIEPGARVRITHTGQYLRDIERL